jgi:hypothetical protein
MLKVEYDVMYCPEDGVEEFFRLEQDGRLLASLTRKEAGELLDALEQRLTNTLLP